MVCMGLRMSSVFAIQKSDLRHFFRHLCPGTRKSSHMLFPHYMRGKKKIYDLIFPPTWAVLGTPRGSRRCWAPSKGLTWSRISTPCALPAPGEIQYSALRVGQLSPATAEVLLASSVRHVTEPVDYWQR
jgi:hypothetical protein